MSARYPLSARLLHWAMAALLLSMLCLGAAMVDREPPGDVEQVGDTVDHADLAVGIEHHPHLDERLRRFGQLHFRHGEPFVGIGPHNVVSANPAQGRSVLPPSYRDGHPAPPD